MKAAEFKREAGDELRGILRYWMENTPDWKHGGFLGRIDEANRSHPDAPKGLQLNSSILWTFSAASWFARNDIYLAVARRAYEYIDAHFIDHLDGGAWWCLDAAGRPLDRHKDLTGQALLIYGLSEYYHASDDLVALRQAISLFRFIGRRAGEEDSKTFQLELLEAYTNLYRHWQDENLRKEIIGLLTCFERQPCLNSYGHDIEAAWQLPKAAGTIGDEEWMRKAAVMGKKLATAAAEGLDADGGLRHLHETDHHVSEKYGWAQAEAIVGFLHAWEASRDEIWWRRSTACWNFIRQYISDPKGNEWYQGVLADHSPIPGQDKAGFSKCPMHSARACMEVVRLLTDRERAAVSGF